MPGFLLSPYLLLLVIEGLSMAILVGKRERNTQGIKVGDMEYLTQLFFVDDVYYLLMV